MSRSCTFSGPQSQIGTESDFTLEKYGRLSVNVNVTLIEKLVVCILCVVIAYKKENEGEWKLAEQLGTASVVVSVIGVIVGIIMGIIIIIMSVYEVGFMEAINKASVSFSYLTEYYIRLNKSQNTLHDQARGVP